MPIQETSQPARSAQLPSGVSIQPRRFEFADLESVPQHWFAGNPLLTHFENAFSIFIPPGERFFIRSVRNFEDRVSDPEFRAMIRAFVQQEALHGSAHSELNRAISKFGIDVEREEAAAERFIQRLEKHLPNKVKLGMTAFLEHLTATGASALFALPVIGESMDEQMLGFWRWHAAEELEHKAVAFDLFHHVGGSYALRIFCALSAVALLSVPFVRCARRMIKQDPTPITREVRRQAGKLNRPVAKYQMRLLAAYFKPGFHPWKLDDEVHLREWYRSPERA